MAADEVAREAGLLQQEPEEVWRWRLEQFVVLGFTETVAQSESRDLPLTACESSQILPQVFGLLRPRRHPGVQKKTRYAGASTKPVCRTMAL
jgi:hypothetical protein